MPIIVFLKKKTETKKLSKKKIVLKHMPTMFDDSLNSVVFKYICF